MLVDNYDSFSYNIAHLIGNRPGTNLQIIQPVDLNIKDIEQYDKIIFSPGPDLPRPGNIMERILTEYSGIKSFLGICLGFQAIVLFFGGRLHRLDEVVHGKKKWIEKTGCSSRILNAIPQRFEAGLYHSWTADPDYLPDSLMITALSDDGMIMGVRHRIFDIEAVQFHPESIMTPEGKLMLSDWLYC